MTSFLADLAYGARVLRKTPAFSIIVIGVLALGLGANTAVFSVVEAVLLRALPFPRAERLVMIWEKNPSLGGSLAERVPVALSNCLEWQKRATQFEAIGGYEEANFNLTGVAQPERVQGARVTQNFFHVLGVEPALGRNFENLANEQVAILSDAFFQRRYGGDRNILGSTLTMNDIVYTIGGVLPPQFHLPATRQGQNQSKPDLYVPYDSSAAANTIEFNRRKLQVFARLRDGVSLEQARAEMSAIAARLAEEDATQNAGFSASVYPVYLEDVGQDQRRNLFILLATVGFVLLIACANVANLMLTRAAARERELAVRKALGASRVRLVRQMLAESILLSGAGALLGLGLAHFGIKILIALQPAGINRPEEIHLGLPVFFFTALVSLGVALLFGTLPAWRAAGVDVLPSLNQTRGAQAASSGRARKFLVVSEVALACVLLVGAGFMIKSLVAVLRVDPGFKPDHLLTMKFSLPESRYGANEQIAAFCQQVLEKISATPGVQHASFSDGLPLTRLRMMRYTVEGQEPPPRGSEPTADMRGIFNPDYFATVGIHLLAGRNFSAAELAEKKPVVVINQTLAKRLWPNESALGQHVRSVPSKAGVPVVTYTVIGVVNDTHQTSLEEAQRPEITKAMGDYTQLTLAVRTTTTDPSAMIPAINQQIWSVDRNVPMFEVATMDQVLRESTSERRFQSLLMVIFAGLALVLSGVGLYGVLSSLVAQRTQEIGIRMALGAQTRDVLRLILLEGARMVLLGLALGLAAGLALTRYLSSLLFGLNATSIATYLEVALVMATIAALACLLPAWRALRVDPMVSLRYE